MEGIQFLEKDLSYRLVGCFYKIRNFYGSAHREKLYDTVAEEVFAEAGLQSMNKPRIALHLVQTGQVISYFIPDKLIENKILVEFKAKPFTSQEDVMQAYEYLNITDYEILYLVNFGERNFKPRRFISTKDRKMFLRVSINNL